MSDTIPTDGADLLPGTTGPDQIDGQDGNDTITGDQGDDTLHGGGGSDYLLGGPGNDLLSGGAGSDFLNGNAGDDTLDGGEITDTLNFSDLNNAYYSDSPSGVVVDLANGEAQDGWGGTDTLLNIIAVGGSNHDDSITGGTTSTFEQFDGLAGNDTIDGGTIGNTANRVLYQSAGAAVTVDLQLGTATGGGGNDTLVNINQVTGSVHGDILRGSDSTLYTETFIGRQGNDTIDGRGGYDIARYDGQANANLATGEAYDGEGGKDTLIGIEGLRGSRFGDVLTGGNAASDAFEFFIGMGGNDTIDGGSGYDRADYNTAADAVYASLQEGIAYDGLGGIDTLSDIEGLRGGGFDDSLTGNAVANRLEGGAGMDTLVGGAGDDTLVGDAGDDTLVGDVGRDVFGWGPGSAGDEDWVQDLEVGDSLYFSGLSFEELLDVPASELEVGQASLGAPFDGVTTLYVRYAEGESGVLTVALNGEFHAGDFVFDTYDGQGAQLIRALVPTEDDDELVGGRNDEFLDGLGGNDTLVGEGGNDTLLGGAGDDTLAGGTENDSLVGGEGNDLLHGEEGSDTLVGGAGDDTIDGGPVTDRINYADLNTLMFTGATEGVVVDLGAGEVSQDGQGGFDTVVNIVSVVGTNFDDTLVGGTEMGFEQFDGAGGDDLIDGGALGTTTSNRVTYAAANAAVSVDLEAGSAFGAASGTDTLVNINQVSGSRFNDTLTGSDATDYTETFIGRAGNDTIDGRGGNDIARYEAAAVANLATGVAQDGQGGTDTLLNIEGLRGSSFNDALTGGNAANDGFEFFIGMGGNDTLDGGSGYDRVDYTTALAGVEVVLGESGWHGWAYDGLGGVDRILNMEAVRAGSFNDQVDGNSGANRLEGGAGDDSLFGGGGNDTLVGDAGDDLLVGGDGSDIFGWGASAAGNSDHVEDLELDDSLYFAGLQIEGFLEGMVDLETGQASIGEGEDGTTIVRVRFAEGETGIATIVLHGRYTAANFSLEDDDGKGTRVVYDHVFTSAGDDHVIGGSDNETFDGLAGDDHIEGRGGRDTLVGGEGNDTLLGGAGADTLQGGLGDDSLDGGEVTDRVNYNDLNTLLYTDAASGVDVNLGSGQASDGHGGTDTIANFVAVTGSSHDDTLTGGTEMSFEMFEGGAGDDLIDGGELGTTTSNRASYASAGAAVRVDLAAGTAQGAATGTDTLVNINQVAGSSFGDTLLGSDTSAYTESFIGRGGNDTIDGAGGTDVARYDFAVVANLATGTATGSEGTDTLRNVEGLRGSSAADSLTGGNTANNAFEFFTGMGGNDTIDGGVGYDRADYTTATFGVNVNLATGTATDGLGGTDTLRNIEAVRGGNHGDLLVGSTAANRLEGGTGDDYLEGGAGNDTLVGDDHDDTLVGGAGRDVFGFGPSAAEDFERVQDLEVGDSLYFSGVFFDTLEPDLDPGDLEAGMATLHQAHDGRTMLFVRYEGKEGVAAVELLGAHRLVDFQFAPSDGLGTRLTYVLTPTGGNDFLSGGSNDDLIQGLAGNDTLQGMAGNDTLDGGTGADLLRGGLGNDTYVLDHAGDNIDGEAGTGGGTDTVLAAISYSAASDYVENVTLTGSSHTNATGNQLANVLTGNAGANVLNGGTGADTMAGGLGNDTYYVDNAGDDISGESSASSGGVDTVVTTIDWSAAKDAVEKITAAAGTSAIDLTGNALANTLTGNAGANILDGGTGADTMAGGLGNDTYRIDNAKDDISGESSAASGGVDTVITTIDWSAAKDAVEKIIAATGTSAIDLTGNTLANTLTGNDGKNILDGGAGADTMAGGKGNDTYYVDNAKDDISGESSASSGGIDTVFAGVSFSIASDQIENLVLAGSGGINGTGNGLANAITGNGGGNLLSGGSGNDTLDGGGGADTLTGGSNADRFVYDAASDSTLKALDRITDFTRGSDRIDLSHLDGNAGKSGHQDFSFIGSKAFSANATGQLRFAVESGKVMLYGSTDADSTAEFAVQVSGTTTLSGSDFLF